MLCEEADCLISSFDGGAHLIGCSSLADKVCLSQLRHITIGGPFSVDDVLKVFVSEGVFSFGGVCLLILIVVVSLVERQTAWATIHIDVFHLLVHLIRYFAELALTLRHGLVLLLPCISTLLLQVVV